jgi:LysR family transcriptional regulator, nitrogen assimilation regulatory protein
MTRPIAAVPGHLDHELRLFVRVARAGSLRVAAEELNLSQAALSKSIKKLEDALGGAVFVRHGRGLRPTPQGLQALESLQRGFNVVDETLSGLVDGRGFDSLSIASVSTLASYMLPAFSRQFLLDWPRVQLKLWSLSSPDVVDAVLHGRTDLGLVYDVAVAEREVKVWRLLDEELVGYVPSRAAAPASQTLSDFCAQPLVLPPREFAVRRVVERELGRSANPLIECNSVELTLDLVAAGVGATILPRQLPAAMLTSRALVPIGLSHARLTRQVVLIQHRTASARPSLGAAIELLQAVASRLES